MPRSPRGWPFYWVYVVSTVTPEEFLYMAGLDAYVNMGIWAMFRGIYISILLLSYYPSSDALESYGVLLPYTHTSIACTHHTNNNPSIVFKPQINWYSYMLLRYIKLCIRVCFFFSLAGFIVLMPVYYTASNSPEGLEEEYLWVQYTIANVKDATSNSSRLWVPVVFA